MYKFSAFCHSCEHMHLHKENWRQMFYLRHTGKKPSKFSTRHCSYFLENMFFNSHVLKPSWPYFKYYIKPVGRDQLKALVKYIFKYSCIKLSNFYLKRIFKPKYVKYVKTNFGKKHDLVVVKNLPRSCTRPRGALE